MLEKLMSKAGKFVLPAIALSMLACSATPYRPGWEDSNLVHHPKRAVHHSVSKTDKPKQRVPQTNGIPYASSALNKERFDWAVNLWENERTGWKQQAISQYPSYAKAVSYYAGQHQVPLELMAAVSAVESAFNPSVVSQEGAAGLTQIMPSLAADEGLTFYGTSSSKGTPYAKELAKAMNGKKGKALAEADQRFDPGISLNVLGKRLHQYHDKFGSWEAAFVGWNGGESRAGSEEGWLAALNGEVQEAYNFPHLVFAMQQQLNDAGLFMNEKEISVRGISPARFASLSAPTQAYESYEFDHPLTLLGDRFSDQPTTTIAYQFTPKEGDTNQSVVWRFRAGEWPTAPKGRLLVKGNQYAAYFVEAVHLPDTALQPGSLATLYAQKPAL